MRRFTALYTNSVPNSLANYGRASFPGHVRGCLTELSAVLSQRARRRPWQPQKRGAESKATSLQLR